MQTVLFLVVIGTSIWVGVDASHLGVRRGRLAGSPLDMGVGSWVVCCLFLWAIAFPCYLVARGKYQAMRGTPQVYGGGPPAANGVPGPGQLGSAAGPGGYSMGQQGAPGWSSQPPPTAPPQMSPDGRWWWNGQQWVPTTSPAPPFQP